MPLHRVRVKDPLTEEAILEFDAPAFKAERVLRLMREQAEGLDREDFLRRWSSAESRRQQLLEARIQSW